jgi:alpha,alpha-trehalose-phosphate synthase [UDP-forming]
MVATVIMIATTVSQLVRERQRLNADMARRSRLLAESFHDSIGPGVASGATDYVQRLVTKYSDRERFAGMVVYDHREQVIAVSPNLHLVDTPDIVAAAMDEGEANDVFLTLNTKPMYLLAIPMKEEDKIIGALMVAQNANYIDERMAEIWKNTLIRLSLQFVLIGATTYFVLKLFVYQPITYLVSSVNTSQADFDDNLTLPFFKPLTKEISKLKRKLIEAKLAASEEAKHTLERIDSPWTAERLQEYAKKVLQDRTLVVISNREPFVHIHKGKEVAMITPASGMVTAINPLMEACGGTWVAQATGDADVEVVDEKHELLVPPDDPKYTLKRIWLNQAQATGFYDGFCNEALWPLLHMSHTRPIFRASDWQQYREVNQLFADAVLKQIKNIKNPLILVQDFHFTLLPRLIKSKRPDVLIGLFWHIPWIGAEHFSICPMKKEILHGMLGADLIGFHTQLHCNNFIDTVAREMESLVDYEHFTITKASHRTWIKPFPISIAFTNDFEQKAIEADELVWREKVRREYKITGDYIGLGVDRLDYTKGILERLKAVEIFLQQNPRYQGLFTFIQVAAPTRENVARYQEFAQEVRDEVERINRLFKTNTWKPIVLLERHFDHKEINRFYRMAQVCLVTSLHDGMNLVAKEFVAARHDILGVLVLSSYTGASRELTEALIVNPYDGEETAQAIKKAFTMSTKEQRKRMDKMRQSVRDANVYRWSATFIKTLVSLG